MRPLSALFLSSLLAVLPAASESPPFPHDELPPDFLLWRCWYEPGQPAVACRLEHGPDEPGGDPLPPESGRAMARAIRAEPGRMLGVPFLIPLYAPPIDMNQAVRLARNVVCFRQPHCRVEFSMQAPG